MQTGKRTDLPKILQSQWEEEQRKMQNKALVKSKTPAKVEEPKSAMLSSASTSTATTTIAKIDLQKERVKEQKQKKEEKKEKATRKNPK